MAFPQAKREVAPAQLVVEEDGKELSDARPSGLQLFRVKAVWPRGATAFEVDDRAGNESSRDDSIILAGSLVEVSEKAAANAACRSDFTPVAPGGVGSSTGETAGGELLGKEFSLSLRAPCQGRAVAPSNRRVGVVLAASL